MATITVLCCAGSVDRPAISGVGGVASAEPGAGRDAPTVEAMLRAAGGLTIQQVGRRPGKEIDGLLAGRIVVLGDDADLAAVVLRLLRRDLLRSVVVSFAATRPTPVTEIWSLPTGPRAIDMARQAEVDAVPLIRDDVGGVLVGAAQLIPIRGTVYVDENRVLAGTAQRVLVEPDQSAGLAVTVAKRRFLGVFGRRPQTVVGRAVEFGLAPGTAIVRDGVPYPRPMNRWVFYTHTERLRLVRGVF